MTEAEQQQMQSDLYHAQGNLAIAEAKIKGQQFLMDNMITKYEGDLKVIEEKPEKEDLDQLMADTAIEHGLTFGLIILKALKSNLP